VWWQTGRAQKSPVQSNIRSPDGGNTLLTSAWQTVRFLAAFLGAAR